MIENKKKEKRYNKVEITNLFSISSATLDNWVRTAIPKAMSNNLYDYAIIDEFIKSQNKLSKRANRKNSGNIELPRELLNYLTDSSWVSRFIKYLEKNDIQIVSHEIIQLYKDRLNNIQSTNELSTIIPHNDLYSYSVAYQIVLSSGEKSKTGAYYTPKHIVQEVVNSLVNVTKKFLEPCCGVGFFTVEYIKSYKEKFKKFPEGLIYANEIDPISAEITKLNILNVTNGNLKNFNVSCGDGLSLNYNDFDLILTNPPYGIKNLYSELKSTEIFAHFIHKCLNTYLKDDGVLNFILPYSVLSVDKHKEVRKYFLDNFTLDYIKHYGKTFDGVFSDIIALQICKKTPKNNKVKMINGSEKMINQSVFCDNNYVISNMDSNDEELFKKYNLLPHITLKDCIFSLGIVTGNNSKFLFEKNTSEHKRIISGKEISQGFINYNEAKFILNKPEFFQQKPAMTLFDKKKIVYKFISKNIVSAVDNLSSLTLNSANFFILQNVGLEEEYVSALLNSNLLNDIYSKKNGAPLKVLKKSLQDLPIFVFTEDVRKNIVENYKIGKHQENDKIIYEEVDKLLAGINCSKKVKP